jgi:hypothetical protein
MQQGAIGELFQKSGPEGRRIGRRVAATGLWFDWYPVTPQRRRRLRRCGPVENRAQVVNLSVTGAMMVVWNAMELTPGALVDIGLDGATGQCRIRRIAARDQGAIAYGVQFTYLDAELLSVVENHVDRDPTLEDRWHHAR